jgi:hypothetical protein
MRPQLPFRNVVVKAAIIAELEFSDIERETFGADLVERADDTALEDARKAFNRLSVHPRPQRIDVWHGQRCHGGDFAFALTRGPQMRIADRQKRRDGIAPVASQLL